MEMDKFNNYFLKVEKSFETLNSKIENLQDLVLFMKSRLDYVVRNKVDEYSLSKLTIIADDNLEEFLDVRPPTCQVLDECTTLVERKTFKVLRLFMEKGAKSAVNLINSYIEFSKTAPIVNKCPDDKCLEKALKIFKTLEELIITSEEISVKELFSLRDEMIIEDGCEEEMCELLSPLSNVIRLKILKNLFKGPKYYSQLENQIGVKGGHLLHHIKNLKNAHYITKKEQKGSYSKYSITDRGIKALKFLNELKDVFVLAS